MKSVLIAEREFTHLNSGTKRVIANHIKLLKKHFDKIYLAAEKIDQKLMDELGLSQVKILNSPVGQYWHRKWFDFFTSKKVEKLKVDQVWGHGNLVNQDVIFLHNCVHLANELITGKKISPKHQVARFHQEIFDKRNFKVLVANSNMMKKDLVERFKIDSSKIMVNYPAYDASIFHLKDSEEWRDKFRDEYKLNASDLVVGLITSGDFPKRNVELFIKAAFETIKKTDQKIHFVIAGKNKDSFYQSLIDDFNISDQVKLLPLREDVLTYYHGIDIFVLPAKIEEFGLSILESMACGKPVICGKNIGAAEILEGESKDFILNSLEVSEFSNKLLSLINNPELRLKLSEINAKTALNYTQEKQNQKLESELVDRGILSSST